MNKDCPYAIGFQCGHQEWLLSDGKPYLYCKAVREIKNGCPLKEKADAPRLAEPKYSRR